MFTNHRFLRIISMCMAVVVLLLCLPLAGFIQSAYATGGQDLQTLVNATPAGGTLNLTKDYIGKKDSWGNNENVILNKAITISGPSGSSVKINWIRFKVEADNVTLQNLRFEEGDEYYGAVHSLNKGADNLTVKNCVFNYEKNKNWLGEKRVPWAGQAAYLVGCKNVTFQNCTFKYCEAEQDGGAVYLEDSDNAKFISCTFENNRATSPGSQGGTGTGGAVYVKDTDGVSIQNCSFKYNFAEQYGGAVFIKRSKNISVSGSTFSQNDSTPAYAIVEGPYGMGAALAIRNSESASLSGCTFQSNTAYMGAGVFAAESDISIENSSFYSNDVERKATVSAALVRKILETSLTIVVLDPSGIIELFTNYALTAATCPSEFAAEFTSGTGKIGGEGGGIYAINSKLRVNSSMFSGNNAEKLGGGIYVAGSNAKTAEIKNSTFQYNISGSGGGAIANMMPGMVVDNCIIKNNVSEAGGGLYSVTGCTVTNTAFTSNTASLGGAVCANTISNEQKYQGCLFDANNAKSGGAIYAHGSPADGKGDSVHISKCKAIIKDCEFKNNNAINHGGALSLYYITARMDNVIFTKNTSGEKGGAIYNDYLCDTQVAWCEFTENKSGLGGAAYNNLSALNLQYGKFMKNEGNTGAGVIHDVSGNITLANGLFTGNKTQNQLSTNGSILYLDHTANCKVTNCTIANNYPTPAPNNMSAIYLKNGAKLTLRNNIILSNTVPENVSSQDITAASGCTIDAKYNMCALSGTGNITGNIDVFRDSGGGDYHLGYGFMWGYLGAVEAGTNNIDAYSYDLDHKTRKIDNDGDGTWAIDLGCYEQQYVRITFGIDASKGTISGDTEQWILRGTKPDLSAVTITPAAGYEFDHWKTASGVVFNENAVFYYGRTVYAVMGPKKISVAFEYDTTKLSIANAGSGSKEAAGGNLERLVISVPYNTAPVYPTMKGINGWQFVAWSPSSAPVTANILITASAKPTATYDFGKYGYYKENSTQTSKWVTDVCNPLASPIESNVVCNPGKAFLGWSLTDDNTVDGLPVSITGPAVYYAVYGAAQVNLTVAVGGGSLSKDPSKTYDYGTKINLSDTNVLALTPPSGYYFIGFKDASNNAVSLKDLLLTENTTITAQYAAVPTGTLTIITTDTSKGVINLTAAEDLGYTGTTTQVTKNAPFTAAENLISVIAPQGIWDFAGFTAEASGGNLTLTAVYNPSLFKLILNFLKTFHPWSIGFSGAFESSVITLESRAQNSIISLSTGGTADFSAYGYFAYGTVIDLSQIPVQPDTGYRLLGWQNGSGQFITSVTLTADTQVVAVFEPITYMLTVLKSGAGSINASLPGTYDYGEVAWLDASLATAGGGYTFTGFKDGSGNFISSILMDGDKTVTAVFKPNSCVVTLKPNDNGSLEGDCYILTETGASINLSSITCTPDEGYAFSHWEDEAKQTVSVNYTVTGDQTLMAVFEPVSYTLSVTCQGSGSVTAGLTGSYAQGSTVYLNSSFVTPDSGYMFDGFIDGSGKYISCVTMNANKTVIAKFTAQQYPLNIYTKSDDGVKPYAVHWYASGTTVNLSSIPISVIGTLLDGWLNEDLDSVSTVTVNSETTVYAVLINSGTSTEEETELNYLYASFADAVYAYDGTQWLPTPVAHAPALALAAHEGKLYGAFGDGIYLYDGTNWDLNKITAGVASSLVSHNGQLYGSFTDATYVYNGTGTSWTLLTYPTTALVSYQGYLYASFADAVYAYDGIQWLLAPVAHVPALTLASHAGNLFGAFGDGIYVYDGTSWDPEKITPGVASSLAFFNDQLYGSFTDATYVYNGNQWTLLTYPTTALAAFPVDSIDEQ